LPKRCSFFPGATFLTVLIYRTPTKFPGGVKVKRTAQVDQGGQNCERFSQRAPEIFQEGQSTIRTCQNSQEDFPGGTKYYYIIRLVEFSRDKKTPRKILRNT